MSPARATYIPTSDRHTMPSRKQKLPPVWGHRPPVFVGYGATNATKTPNTRTANFSKYALLLGVCSLIFCWVPFAGILMGVTGIFAGSSTIKRMRHKGETAFTAALGKWSSIIGVIVSAVIVWQVA